MKELSIEEKAKCYDEAYKVAKNIHIFSSDLAEIKRMEEIFPELKEESEGERIKKRICKLLWDNAPYEEAQEYIAWLEKQGNINPTEDELEALRIAAYEPTKNWSEKLQSLYEKLTNCEQGEKKPVFEMKTPEESLGIDSNTYNKIVDECIYGEQKPAWSEDDERILVEMLKIFSIEKFEGYNIGENNEDALKFLKSLKDRVLPQSKQEWSEEDKERFESCIKVLQTSDGYDTINAKWLKSLKDRVQPKQEWSKEDEVKINRIVACIENLNVADNDILLKDVDWLKSLKERVENEKDKHQ